MVPNGCPFCHPASSLTRFPCSITSCVVRSFNPKMEMSANQKPLSEEPIDVEATQERRHGIQQYDRQQCRQHASNGTASSQAAPHRKNAAQHNRSDSPYQGRTAQKDNPTQLIIQWAVDFLIRQVEAGKSETPAAYLTAMARFHNYSFLCCD
jgi:hypothetical protein